MNQLGSSGADLIRRETMMWTNEDRSLYDRSAIRYPSDLTDAHRAPDPACEARPQADGHHARSGQRRDVRAFRALFVLADAVYGSDLRLRRMLEGRGQPCVLAARSNHCLRFIGRFYAHQSCNAGRCA